MSTHLISQRYQVEISDNQENFIGQGGMGTVYIGRDVTDNTPVAVKQLKSDIILQDPEIVRRFALEGEALRRLNHPNIVKMLAAEDCDNSHFLVMEFVAGGSLRDVLDETPRLTIQRALYIALDLADALTRAHRLKILHRDIKPANVLIAEDGTPRLTDFGMARVQDVRVTQSGMIVGTLSYLSPESLLGDPTDERADIWAFGVMLFEMLTGERPFPETNPGALVNSIMTKAVPDLEAIRPDAPTALVDLIYRMLAKDVHARIPSVRLIGAELEAIIRGNTSSMQPIVSPDTDGRFSTPTPLAISDQIRQSQILPPHNIPQSPTAFVGREAELSELSTLIDDESIRLITLLGPGGIGKTRIAMQAGQRHLAQFPDGVYFVGLAPLENPENLVTTIADHIDFTFAGSNDTTGELISYLAEKQMLLILDNFEHLIDKADLVGDILSVAPKLTLLVTSRERLRLRGEHLFEVDGMILPPVHTLPAQLGNYPATDLFLQSAHRVMLDFEIDEENAPSVIQIIRLVQGLPLGIELAAAWLEMLPIDEIVQEIENSLDFLETDLRDVPERHRSIRAVFEYSWNLMTPEEQDVFLKLSIFRGGFEREAAQKIAGASLKNLTGLVNKSLLIRMPSGRYQAHKLLRQYAEDRWDDDATKAEVHKLHATYYCEYLIKIADVFNSTKEQAAVESIETELENIRIAWQWGVQAEMWDRIDQAIHPMMLFFQARSMLNDGIKAFRELGDILERKGLTDATCYHRARLRQAWLMSRQGNYETVYRLSEGAANYFMSVGDKDESCYALNNMSYARMMLGEYLESQELARQALDYAVDPHSGNISPWFFTMGNLGYAVYLCGELQEAKRIYEETNNLAIELHYSPVGLAYGLNNLGEIERNLGDMDRAQELFAEAFDIFKRYQNLRGMAFSLNNLGGVMFRVGNTVGAHGKYEESYRLHREVGDITGTAHSLSALGNIASSDGNYPEAKKYYSEALELRRGLGNQRGIAESLCDLAGVELNSGNMSGGTELLDEAIEIQERIGDKQGLTVSKSIQSISYLYSEEYELAEQAITQSLELARETNNMFTLAQSLIGMSMVNIMKGNLDEAHDTLIESLDFSQRQGLLVLMLMGLTVYAKWLHAKGDLETALMVVTQVLLYPSNYIRATEHIAQMLNEKLITELDGNTVREAQERGRSLDMDQLIVEIVKNG